MALVESVAQAVTIPVIASSGAGCPDHFAEVFQETKAAASLAAVIFNRQEVAVSDVKKLMASSKIPTRV